MPNSIEIAAFVFGAILILIAILGGNFKLFGSEISESVSNRWLRFISFVLGAALIVIALDVRLQGISGPPPPTPTPTPTLTLAPPSTPTPTPTPTPTSTPTPTQPSASGCTITVDHAFATFSERPSRRARELGRVDSGQYDVLDHQLASWAGREEMWYQIRHDGRTGWIADSPVVISDKTSSCP